MAMAMRAHVDRHGVDQVAKFGRGQVEASRNKVGLAATEAEGDVRHELEKVTFSSGSAWISVPTEPSDAGSLRRRG